jgi:hypothetical protein
MPIDPSCPIVPRLAYWQLCLPLQMQTIVSSVVWCVCVCTLDTYFYLAILAKSHYLLYNLVCAMYPRFLITLDETLATKPVMVRVGQVSVHVLKRFMDHSTLCLGGGCGWTSWSTKSHYWIPDTHNTCPVGTL